MTTITDTFTNAALADTAYIGSLLNGMTGPALKLMLDNRMTPTLADYISKHFSVVTQIESGGLSSFDATVWRANNEDGSPNPNGKLYVTMRGTQEGADFLADLNLAITGSAQTQLADMVNWWLRISTPAGQSATQIKTKVGGALGEYFESTASVSGTGLISAGDLMQGIEVNGHSLGGYLATAFTRLLGSQAHVSHTSTYNSAGFAPGSETVFTNLQNLIGPSYGLGRFPNTSEQSNYFAAHGLNLTTNAFWFSQQGKRVELFNENDTSQVGNHFMYKLTDALALGVALEKLDSTFTTAKFNALLEAGSNKTEASLEGVLDALRRMLINPNSASTPVGDVSGSAPSRVNYHANLDAFTKTPTFTSLAGKLTLTLATQSLATTAKSDFCAFLSLNALSPFVISTSDAGVIAALKTANPTLATAWQADSDARSGNTSAALSYSDNWYSDCAAMLAWQVEVNKADSPATSANPYEPQNALGLTAVPPLYFSDLASGKELFLGGADRRRFVFGTDQADASIQGGVYSYRLYGGAGNDTLDGLGGNDQLEGGKDFDTYQFSGSWGKDTVVDADGQGRITLEGLTLGEARANGQRNQWIAKTSATAFYVLTMIDDARSSTGKSLTITSALNTSNSITIQNFDLTAAKSAQGYLGIQLDPVKKVAIKEGAGANFWGDINASLATLAGQVSNITEGCAKTFTICLNQAAKANETITLALTSLAAQFKAILGDSVVAADGAVITLAEGQTQVSFALVQEGDVTADASTSISATYAGAEGSVTSNAWGVNLHDAGPISKTKNGDQHPVVDNVFQTYPWITTSWAADGTLSGGVTEANFSDVLNGTAGNDKLSGLGGNDALSGGAGNDEIDGGMGDDLIGGGAGSDRILGGDGNDYITSSATLHVAQRYSLSDSWHPPGAQQVLTQGALWGIYKDTQNGSPVTLWDGPDSPMGQDADVVDAGAGDDWVMASGGDDRVQGGLGDDQIDGLGGNDVLEGGDGKDAVIGDGLIKTGFLNTLAAQYHGADFIDGGAGDDNLVGGGSNDVVYGGLDNDRMWGDGYGKASDADYLDPTYQGNDYLDGEDGNDYMDGGGKDDTLYGGAGDDDMWGDPSASNVDTPAANALVWGNDYLDGATYLVAGSAFKSSATGRFDWKEKRRKPPHQRFRGHWGPSNVQTIPAYSMRLARPKGLGRGMDSEWMSLGGGQVKCLIARLDPKASQSL
jgi:Ca2+-binding RTX toxin-like protein